MKGLQLLLIVLLTACANKVVKQESNIPPLVDVIPKIKAGMNLDETNKILAGNKPSLQFTTTDKSRSLWEFHQRNTVERDNILEDRSAIISFDNTAKVINATTTFCLLPDQEPPLSATPRTSCYQKHLFPFEKQLTYNAIKRFLIISNYQVEHSDAASEIISANGTHTVEGDKDKMMFIKLTIIFTAKEDNTTEVVMSASFSVSEKQSTWVQAGFAGVTVPVPLPFQKKEEWINTGIVTPRFYLNFFDALSNLIASEYLVYQEPKANNTIIPAAIVTPKIESPKETQKQDTALPEFKGAIDSGSNLKKAQSAEGTNNKDANKNEALPEFKGAIDSVSNLKKTRVPEEQNKEEASKTEVLPEFKGAIDSDTNLNKFSEEPVPNEEVVDENTEEPVHKKTKKAKKK